MKTRNLILLMMVAVSLVGCGRSGRNAEFSVATYNIRQINAKDSLRGDGWAVRCPVIAQLVRYHDFDIFGTQEGFRRQLDDLKALLPGYEFTGSGRDDGRHGGEHSAIFYDTAVFELTDSGDFWLSETPDVPGKGWDAACPRVCSWGRFRHRDSGKEFVFFNLHMDHRGIQARTNSAELVLRKIADIGQGIPVFLTGDFNVDQTHKPYEMLTAGGVLADSYAVADEVYALNGTFNSYSTDNFTESRIDHIFVSPCVEVAKYGVFTDTYRTPDDVESTEARDAPREIELKRYRSRTPSDHFPVKINIRL